MATRTTAAKTSSSSKSTPTKSTRKRSAPTKSTATEGAKSTSGKAKAAPKKAAARITAARAADKPGNSSNENYTQPDLRQKIKEQVLAGDKGGRPGQWSARKAQLVAHEYEAQGGGYKHPRNAAQQSLKSWGDEHWHTEDGKQAIQAEVTHRYLPDAAWKELSPEQREATDRKKVQGSKRGKQFVANTPAASKARKHAEKKD